MTEQEWLESTNPGKMLQFVQDRMGARKQRLFVAACCRRIWNLFPDERQRAAVEAGERFADGDLDEPALREAQRLASEAPSYGPYYNPSAAALCAVNPALNWHGVALCSVLWAARAVALARVQYPSPLRHQEARAEHAAHCGLLREVLGNPFRPVAVDPAWLAWGGGTIPELARGVYEDRRLPEGTLDAERLAVLADALEEAGCTDAETLNHCRQVGAHVRGCWVLDLILAKDR
jgi:hypothetical protein